MIANLKPYAEYKESGVSWLGNVPSHWKISRIKTFLREQDYRSVDGSGTLLSLTRLRGLIPHSDMTDKMHSAKTLVAYKRYRPGQIVMNRMQAWSGMFGAGPIEGLVSPDYAVFDILGDHQVSLVLERLKAPDLVGQFALESKGIGSGFNRLYTDRFGPIPISFPPPDEQAAIVRFLDYANRRLERTIRAKRKVIALLNEQKQAIIHRAVTRGLDPNAPLKPSGIPWIGDVPEHWEVRWLKRLGEVKIGLTYSPAEMVGETGTLVLRASNVRNGVIVSADNVYVSKKVPEALLVREGDILICVRSGSRNLVGKSALITSEVAGVTYGAFMSLLRSKDNEFIFWVLNSNLFSCVMAQFETSTINQLTQSDLKNLFIPVPSKTEQADIVAYLKSATSDIDTAISRTEREIALLREYRTRLIADVVTGKLDVREAAKKLPEETAESGIIDNSEISPEDEEIGEDMNGEGGE